MKNRRYRWWVLLVLLWGTGHLHAQVQERDTVVRDTVKRVLLTLQGQVVGNDGGGKKETLPGAYIYLGEEQVPVMTTDMDGRFVLKGLPAGRVQVSVSYIGYETHSFFCDLKEDTDVGEISLKAVLLDEVVVEGKVPLAVQHGDTTKFNAEAVILAPDANLEAFIKKLPGFEIVDGKIMAQGKEVTHLYIDGQEYAFNSSGTALKDLPAKLVKKLAVFDKRSEEAEFSGYDDGKRFRALNIETHDPNRAKIFGYADADYGLSSPLRNTFRENNYSGTLSGSYFAPKHKITFNANAQNTGMRVDFPEIRFGKDNGYNRSGGTHVNVSTTLSEQWDLTGNYRFGKDGSESASMSKQEYFPTERYETRVFDNESRSQTDRLSHALNVSTTYRANRSNRVTFSTRASWGNSNGYSWGYTGNVEDGDTVNVAHTLNGNEGKQANVAGNLSWMKSFAKQGRTATFNMQGSYNRNLSDQRQHHDEHSLEEGGVYSDTVRHLAIGNERKGYDLAVSGTWSEPLAEHLRMVFNYTFREHNSRSEKDGLAYRDEDFKELIGVDSAQTNELRNASRSHDYGVNCNYAVEKLNINGGLSISHTRMDNRYRYLGQADSAVISRYVDVSPMLNFGIKCDEKRNLDLHYSGYSSSPSVTQLQDVLNVQNPLQVSKGNPGLKKSYSHSLSLNYIYTGVETSSYLYGSLHAGQTFNSVSTNMKFIEQDTVVNGYLLKRGASLSVPVNLNGNWNLAANASYAFPWEKLKLRIHTSLGYSFSRTPSIYDDLKNMNSSHTGSLSAHASTNFSENFDCTFGCANSLSFSNNTETGSARYFSSSLNASLSWVFWKGFYAQVYYGGNFTVNSKGERVKQREHMLNPEIGKKFGKGRRVKVYIAAEDVLQTRRTMNYSLSDLYSSTSYHTLPSTILKVGFFYRFDNIRKG